MLGLENMIMKKSDMVPILTEPKFSQKRQSLKGKIDSAVNVIEEKVLYKCLFKLMLFCCQSNAWVILFILPL